MKVSNLKAQIHKIYFIRMQANTWMKNVKTLTPFRHLRALMDFKLKCRWLDCFELKFVCQTSHNPRRVLILRARIIKKLSLQIFLFPSWFFSCIYSITISCVEEDMEWIERDTDFSLSILIKHVENFVHFDVFLSCCAM